MVFVITGAVKVPAPCTAPVWAFSLPQQSASARVGYWASAGFEGQMVGNRVLRLDAFSLAPIGSGLRALFPVLTAKKLVS